MTQKQQLKQTLSNKSLKKDLVEDFKMLEDSIDERELEIEDKFSKEKKKFSLRSRKDKIKIFQSTTMLNLVLLASVMYLCVNLVDYFFNFLTLGFKLFISMCVFMINVLGMWLLWEVRQ